ncbi:MAG: PAS domain-containing sensor histidine kinase [Candidatus Hodarchaeales archaeon]
MKSLQLLKRDDIPIDAKETIIQDMKLLRRETYYRKKAEGSLRSFRHQNRSTLNAIRDPVHIVNENLEIIFMNTALLKILDVLNIDSNILNKKITEVFSFLPENIFVEYLTVFETKSEAVTPEILHIDGKMFTSETYKTPVFREGRVIQIITTIRNITPLCESQNGFYGRSRDFRSIVEQTYDGIVLTDETGKIIEWNHGQEEITGLHASETVGRFLWDVQHELTPLGSKSEVNYGKNKSRITAILNTGTAPWIKKLNEKEITRTDGTSRIIQSGIFPIRTENGFMLGSIARDVTSFHEAEKAKNELENRRSKFIEITSHELRTPLTCIRGFLDFLRSSNENISSLQKEECYDLIDKNISRLGSLIDEVSDLAKIERDALVINKQVINFIDYLNREIKAYKIILGNHFAFYSKSSQPNVYVNIDEDRIRQVIGNVINNAIKHTPNDTRQIYMSVKVHSKAIQLDISDNGAGIALENLDAIFEPFVSIPSEFSVTGTGIGLYVSNEIIKQHDGSIKAISKGLGTGTRIKIVLPRIYPEKEG